MTLNETEKINYKNILKTKIKNILLRKEQFKFTYDILDTSTNEEKIIVLKKKHIQMRYGEIWEQVIGNYKSFKNIKDCSGLDIISYERKIVIELKNRTNTDNSSSRKTNFDKLSRFKKNNQHYTCIYGNINDETQENTMKGSIKKIIHDNEEIYWYTGYKLFSYIFEEDAQWIIDYVKNLVSEEIRTNISI